MRNIPIVTKNLLIVNVVAFLLTFLMGKDASGGYALNDIFGLHFFLASDFQIYQLFTYMFMHGGFEHILFNMFALWMFGCVVERVWGAKKFLFYYIACGVGAGLFQEAAQCHLCHPVGLWDDIPRRPHLHLPYPSAYQGQVFRDRLCCHRTVFCHSDHG